MTSKTELTVEEYRTLVETAVTLSPRAALTVYLVGHTGMRTSEAANFTPGRTTRQDSHRDALPRPGRSPPRLNETTSDDNELEPPQNNSFYVVVRVTIWRCA